MKIVSYNVNGLRAVIQKGLLPWLDATEADFVCLQEVKYDTPYLLDDLFAGLGYAHRFWHPAQKKGYSGVAILSKHPAAHVAYGSAGDAFDLEGRVLRLETDRFALLNAYAPSGTTGDVRQAFKMDWLRHFHSHIEQLRRSSPLPLVLCGDFNIAHQEIDIHNPRSNAKSSGFLPEERQWLTDLLSSGFVDAFRHIHPEKKQYSWWTYRANARAKNLGWRIDYHFVCETLKHNIVTAESLTDVCFSDHCPILLRLAF